MSAAKSFSLLHFGPHREAENPGALNYALIIKVHPPEIAPKSQFWIVLNCIAVNLMNFTELCTLLALERDS